MNRYTIGDIVVHVTFYDDNVVNMKGLCTLHFCENDKDCKEYVINIELLKLIAEPAP